MLSSNHSGAIIIRFFLIFCIFHSQVMNAIELIIWNLHYSPFTKFGKSMRILYLIQEIIDNVISLVSIYLLLFLSTHLWFTNYIGIGFHFEQLKNYWPFIQFSTIPSMRVIYYYFNISKGLSARIYSLWNWIKKLTGPFDSYPVL